MKSLFLLGFLFVSLQSFLVKGDSEVSSVCGSYASLSQCSEYAESWNDDFNQVKSHITSKGAFIHQAVKLGWNPVSGRGLYSSEPLPNNTVIMKIPVTLALHNKTLYEQSWVSNLLNLASGSKPSQAPAQFNQHAIFSIALAQIKQDKPNNWSLLVNNLPSIDQISHLPFYWPRSEFNALKGSFFVKLVTNQMASIVNTWQLLSKSYPSIASKLTQDDFTWGYLISLGYSRWANYTHVKIEKEGFETEPTLQPGFLPILDYLNHPSKRAIFADKNPQTKNPLNDILDLSPLPSHSLVDVSTDWSKEPREVIVKVITPVESGDQLFLFYGDVDTGHLLTNFGFTADYSKTTRAWLPLDIPKTVVNFREKLDFFKGKSVHSCIIGASPANINPCLGFLRVVHGPYHMIPNLQKFGLGPESQAFTSLDLEIPALAHLNSVVKKTLSEYPKIKCKMNDGKVQKLTATEALAHRQNIAWEKYSHRQQLAIQTIITELDILSFFDTLTSFFSSRESIANGDISVFRKPPFADNDYVKQLVDSVIEQRAQVDVSSNKPSDSEELEDLVELEPDQPNNDKDEL